MIQLRNVSKKLDATQVLTNVSFTVPQGSSCALIGLSGSGKSTILKLISGLHFPDSGSIIVENQVLGPKNLHEMRRDLGYVIQEGGLFPHLTSYQNLQLVAREDGWNESHIKSRTKELSDLTKISQDLLAKYPRELSGGERQRICIMRALLLDPSVFLLDEPLGSLDPITRSEMQQTLKEVFSEVKNTVLLVSHDLFEAAFLTEKLLILDRGTIAQEGTLKDLVNKPASEFVERFVGSQRRELPC